MEIVAIAFLALVIVAQIVDRDRLARQITQQVRDHARERERLINRIITDRPSAIAALDHEPAAEKPAKPPVPAEPMIGT